LHIAAYETPTSHLLVGPSNGIRDLARRGAEVGLAVEILPATTAAHSPEMARCTAPLRGILAGTPVAPPRRRLISGITGRQVMPADNIAGLLADQLSLPVLFGQAMALAADGADLLIIAGPDNSRSLAAMATAASGVPAIGAPAAKDDAAAIGALFTAGAVGDLTPSLTGSAPTRIGPVTWAVPPARNGQTADGHTAGGHAAGGQNGAGRETTVRSGKMLLMG
jgi:enediyne polyketide synthase